MSKRKTTAKPSTTRKTRKVKADPKAKSTAMAQALAAAGVVANAGVPVAVLDGAQHNALVLSTTRTDILTNPMEYIDELCKYDPFWGNVALRVLTNNVGYLAVNRVLWDYRKRNQEPEVTSSIDWMNDGIAEKNAKRDNEENVAEQGFTTLTFPNGWDYIGAYKWLFHCVETSPFESNFELPSPASLYHGMRKNDNRKKTTEAYNTFEMEHMTKSANFKYIEERINRSNEQQSEREKKKSQTELDHIHSEFAPIKQQRFDDGVWMSFPLHTQFKMLRLTFNQVNSAIASCVEKPADERLHLRELNNMAEIILLELQMANNTGEIKLAFERNVLKPQHSL